MVRVAAITMAVRPCLDERTKQGYPSSITETLEMNLKKASGLVSQAAKKKSSMVCLPEYFATGYPFLSSIAKTELTVLLRNLMRQSRDRIRESLREIAIAHHVFLIGGSFIEEEGGRIFNTCEIVSPQGKVVGRYRKNIPFWSELYYLTSGKSIPVFETPYCKVGISICGEISASPEIFKILALKGAKIIFCPTLITGIFLGDERNFGEGERSMQETLCVRARDGAVYVAFSCGLAPVKNSKGKPIDYLIRSMIISPQGKILSATSKPDSVAVQDLDIDSLNLIKQSYTAGEPLVSKLEATILELYGP